MRTTLNIDDELLKEAKITAVERDTTLTALVEAALRRELRSAPLEPRAALGPFPVHTGNPLRDLDWDDSSSVLEALDDSIADS